MQGPLQAQKNKARSVCKQLRVAAHAATAEALRESPVPCQIGDSTDEILRFIPYLKTYFSHRALVC